MTISSSVSLEVVGTGVTHAAKIASHDATPQASLPTRSAAIRTARMQAWTVQSWAPVRVSVQGVFQGPEAGRKNLKFMGNSSRDSRNSQEPSGSFHEFHMNFVHAKALCFYMYQIHMKFMETYRKCQVVLESFREFLETFQVLSSSFQPLGSCF